MACLLPFAIASAGRAYYASYTTPPGAAAENFQPQPQPPAETLADDGIIPGRQLWAPQRVMEFFRYKAGIVPSVAAVLSLPKQARDIPVFPGVSEIAMTLGAGHLSDTSPLEGTGNIAVSAHRDGSFRILKDVRVGDPLVLSVGGQHRLFVVKRQTIVNPDETHVLEPTDVTTLTLVTCYPFYFIGDAPKRYIVQAELAEPAKAREVLADWHTEYTARNPDRSTHRMRRNDI